MKTMMTIISIVIALRACKTEKVESKPDPTLTWEAQEDKRNWSLFLKTLIEAHFETFDTAKDATRFCSNYATLSKDEKVKLWAEVFVWTSFYESGWNPKAQSVDVGSRADKNTWSIGLMQLSVVDQKSFGLISDFTFDQLLEPVPNLNLAMQIMVRQIKKTGKVILDNSDKMRYWAVLLDGNKYSKVDKITGHVKTAVGCK